MATITSRKARNGKNRYRVNRIEEIKGSNARQPVWGGMILTKVR